jgi:hypothetical protein
MFHSAQGRVRRIILKGDSRPPAGEAVQYWTAYWARCPSSNSRNPAQRTLPWANCLESEAQSARPGRRVFRKREGEQPIRGANAPHLRIISDESWAAVCERQELVKPVYQDASKRSGLLRSSAMNGLTCSPACCNAKPVALIFKSSRGAAGIMPIRPMVVR